MTNAASVTHQLSLVNTCPSTAPSPNMCGSSSEIGQELISPFRSQFSSPQMTGGCQLGAAFQRNRGGTSTLSQFCCIGGFGRRGITGFSKVQAWWGRNSSGQSRKNFAHGAQFGWQTFAGPSKKNSPPNLPPFSAEIRIYLFEL